MQVMPATAEEMNVGRHPPIEPNIHAGVKYMHFLRDRYFREPELSERNRPLFAFASYNSGAANVTKARRRAEKIGLDPNCGSTMWRSRPPRRSAATSRLCPQHLPLPRRLQALGNG